MPVKGEHTAQIKKPSLFKKIRRVNNRFGKGVHVLFGIRNAGKSQVQSIRFNSGGFTVDAAKKWLKDKNFKPIKFEPASAEKEANLNTDVEDFDVDSLLEKEVIEYDQGNPDCDFDVEDFNVDEFLSEEMLNNTNDKDAKSRSDLQFKAYSFSIINTEEVKSGNADLGIFHGSMATEHTDRGGDIIAPEAFDKSIARYKKSGRRIRMYYQHNPQSVPIGGINPKNIVKNGKNWDIKGELDFGVAQAREVYSALRNKNLSDLSIGFTIRDADYSGKVRVIKDLELWEVSVVGEPMNPKATINEVKSVNGFKDLPIADCNEKWDESAAIVRVCAHTEAHIGGNASYKSAFLWFNSIAPGKLQSYKLLITDVIDDNLTVIPRAIFAAAAEIKKGAKLPAADEVNAIAHLNKYYDKMGLPSPFKSKTVEYSINYENELKVTNNYGIDDVEHIVTKKSFEDLLKSSGAFSRQAATYLAKFFNPQKPSESVTSTDCSKQSESVGGIDSGLIDKIDELNLYLNKFVEKKNARTNYGKAR